MKTRGYQEIVDTLNKRFGGSAKALVQTYGGQIQQLGNQFELAGAIVGERFTKTILGAFELLGEAPGTFANSVETAFLNIDEFTQTLMANLLGVADALMSPTQTVEIGKRTRATLSEIEKEFAGRKKALADSLIDQPTISDLTKKAIVTGATDAAPEVTKILKKAFLGEEGIPLTLNIEPLRTEDLFDDSDKSFVQQIGDWFADAWEWFSADGNMGDVFVEGMVSGNAKKTFEKGLALAGTALGIPLADQVAAILTNLADDPDFLVNFFESLNGLVEGLIANAIPGIIRAIPVIVGGIIPAILSGLSSLLATLFSASFWADVADGFVEPFREAFGKAGDITKIWKDGDLEKVGQKIGAGFTKMARGGTDDMLRDLDKGFRDGGQKAADAIFDGMIQAGKNVAREIRKATGQGGGGGSDQRGFLPASTGEAGAKAEETKQGIVNTFTRRAVTNSNTPSTTPAFSAPVGTVEPGLTDTLTASGASVDSARRLLQTRGF